ncbi:hypothetical protein SAMN04488057_112110 [Cyclobacterium lianum]|uniref:Helix-turn-helix domain-containing protein n=1 Tax=Cyclobacterium lianum TaxID=388280 RepID=A0A1M7Q003_9BACT|nr:transcriptional regulator [Cyclobacterium lianum]SHN23398.1 hypothetical protein SAMN04488057_112110 [Cyclobacterium lianum]
MPGKIHQDRNIKCFPKIHKEEALAHELGADWSQKKISLLEQKETVEDAILVQVSEILKIPVEAIQNFDEEQAVNIISNTFNDQSNGYNYYPTFNLNPVEKWIEALDEIKRLNAEIIRLKDEQIEMLKGMLGKEVK